MVSRDSSFRINADVSDIFSSLRRVEQRAQGVGRRLSNLGGGIRSGLGGGGRAPDGGRGGGGGRGGLAVAGVAGAAAGAVIGLASNLISEILELFKDTPVLKAFQEAIKALLEGVAPIVGVLLSALTPALKALTPALVAVARAVAPLLQLLGAGLVTVIKLLTPFIVVLATALGKLFQIVADFVNRIPGIDISGATFDESAAQVQTARAADQMPTTRGSGGATAVTVQNTIVIDNQAIQRVNRRLAIQRSELGG